MAYSINLSADQVSAWKEMHGVEDAAVQASIESHVQTICDNHIAQNLDAQLQAKTVAEKKALLA